MKVKQSLVLMIAFVCMFGVSAFAQESQTPAPVAPQSPGLDIQGIKVYLLGPGDVLDIRVFGQQDLSSTAQVDGDGNLSSLPFLEAPIKAKCRSEKDVQKDITAAYSKFINNPQVSVRITERNSRQPATIFGAVRQATRRDEAKGAPQRVDGCLGWIYRTSRRHYSDTSHRTTDVSRAG